MDDKHVAEIAKITKLHPLVIQHRYGHSVTFDDVLLALQNYEFLEYYYWGAEGLEPRNWYKENDQAFRRLINLLAEMIGSFDKAVVFRKFADELFEKWSGSNANVERNLFSELFALANASLCRTAESLEEIVHVWELLKCAEQGGVGTCTETDNAPSVILLDKLYRIGLAGSSAR